MRQEVATPSASRCFWRLWIWALSLHATPCQPLECEGGPVSGREWRRFERFAEVRENPPNRPGLRDEGDQPDISVAVRALERKLLTHPGQQFRPGNPRGVVRAAF
jgi:hypothetical protein